MIRWFDPGLTTPQSYGGHSEGETPGPIPNPEAKPFSADGTAPATVWESRTPPDTIPQGRSLAIHIASDLLWRFGVSERRWKFKYAGQEWLVVTGPDEFKGKSRGRGDQP